MATRLRQRILRAIRCTYSRTVYGLNRSSAAISLFVAPVSRYVRTLRSNGVSCTSGSVCSDKSVSPDGHTLPESNPQRAASQGGSGEPGFVWIDRGTAATTLRRRPQHPSDQVEVTQRKTHSKASRRSATWNCSLSFPLISVFIAPPRSCRDPLSKVQLFFVWSTEFLVVRLVGSFLPRPCS
jgi:hypothetical protein